MKSNVGQIIEEMQAFINKLGEIPTQEQSKFFADRLNEFQEAIHPIHENGAFDYENLTTNVMALASMASLNIIANQKDMTTQLMLTMAIQPLLHDRLNQAIIAFAMKFAIILFQAEEQAQKKASEALPWVVSPELGTEVPPSSDQPAQPPAESPATS